MRVVAADASTNDPSPGEAPAVLDALVATRRRFLSFLERQVGNAADAEDILQAAYVKGIERLSAIRETERAIAWFFRLLRNAVTDHLRRRAAEGRALEARTRSLSPLDEAALRTTVCDCFRDLLPALPEEYALILRRVDLEGIEIARVAAERGITPNNARVRLHRARRELKRQLQRSCGTCTEHGCLDCDCGR